MKQTLLFLIFLILVSFARAQKTQDVLYLRNGGIMRGSIIENSDTLVKILTYGDNVFAYPPGQIRIIVREPAIRKDFSIKESGFFTCFSAGILFGQSGDDKPAPFSAMMESFYKYRENYAMGVFLGFEQLKENIVPMGITFKYFVPLRKPNLVFGISGGYGKPAEDPKEEYIIETKGGIVYGAEAGILFPVGEGYGIFLSAGYRYNELNYVIEDWWVGDYKRKIKFNRLLIRMGISLF